MKTKPLATNSINKIVSWGIIALSTLTYSMTSLAVGPYVYQTSMYPSGRLIIMDIGLDNQMITLDLQGGVNNLASGIATSMDGKVYVANWWQDTINVIDTADGTFTDLDQLEIPREPDSYESMPYGIAVGEDGKIYTVSNFYSDLTIFDPENDDASITIPLSDTFSARGPRGIAITPENKIYVANEGSDNVSVIDTDLDGNNVYNQITLPVDSYPYGIAIAPDGKVYVANSGGTIPINDFDGDITVIDPNNNNATTQIALSGGASKPYGIAVAEDGKIYTANSGSDDVTVIDPDDNYNPEPIDLNGATNPYGIAVADDGKVYVGTSDNITIIDPDNDNKVTHVPLPDGENGPTRNIGLFIGPGLFEPISFADLKAEFNKVSADPRHRTQMSNTVNSVESSFANKDYSSGCKRLNDDNNNASVIRIIKIALNGDAQARLINHVNDINQYYWCDEFESNSAM